MKSTMKICSIILGLFLITSFLKADNEGIKRYKSVPHKFNKITCDSLELEHRIYAISQVLKTKQK